MCAVNSVFDFVWFPVQPILCTKIVYIGQNKKEWCVCSKVVT